VHPLCHKDIDRFTFTYNLPPSSVPYVSWSIAATLTNFGGLYPSCMMDTTMNTKKIEVLFDFIFSFSEFRISKYDDIHCF
jgi:hypothetical protein